MKIIQYKTKNLMWGSMALALVTISGLALYAQYNGIMVSSPLYTDPNATFPLGYANLMKGGFHQVQTASDLTNFPVSRQETGMIIYVVATDSSYRLMRTKTPPLSIGTDLVKVQSISDGSGGGISNITNVLSGDGSGLSYWIPDANGNLQNIGTGDVKLTSGTRLYFGEPTQNGDPVYIERTDAGNNTSRLRINIGDENLGGGDGLEIGSNIAGSWNTLFRLNDAGIGIAFPRSYNTQGTTTRRLNPRTSTNAVFTEHPNQTYGFNEAYTRCACDTSDYSVNCSLNQVTTNMNSCVDLKNIRYTQVQSTCYSQPWGTPYSCFQEATEYTYDMYAIDTQTTQGTTQNYTMNYINTSGSQIFIGDQTGSTTIDKTITNIGGDLKINNLLRNTQRTNPRSVVTIDGNNTLSKSIIDKPSYQDFYSAARTYRISDLNDAGYTQGTSAPTNGYGGKSVKMIDSREGFCFLTTVGIDTDKYIGGNEEYRSRVWIQVQSDGYRYLRAFNEGKFHYEGGATCIMYP